jgi:hypothetical protein
VFCHCGSVIVDDTAYLPHRALGGGGGMASASAIRVIVVCRQGLHSPTSVRSSQSFVTLPSSSWIRVNLAGAVNLRFPSTTSPSYMLPSWKGPLPSKKWVR